jgi:hypothetical protein
LIGKGLKTNRSNQIDLFDLFDLFGTNTHLHDECPSDFSHRLKCRIRDHDHDHDHDHDRRQVHDLTIAFRYHYARFDCA